MWGIFSNHSLDDETVYDDDWILHASDQDYLPYYRTLNSLPDSTRMEGNCLHAGSGFGKNEMYPCFDEDITYGLAVLGLNITGKTLPTYLSTSGAVSEPQIRSGERPSKLTGTVTVTGLTGGSRYTIYRYDGTDTLPASTASMAGFTHSHTFMATATHYEYADPNIFLSSSAVYYVTTPAPSSPHPTPLRATATPKVPGLGLPLVSLGTGSGMHADVAAATELWVKVGGIAIDTAYVYGDEDAIAEGLANAGVPAWSMYITTKIPCSTYADAKAHIASNLKDLKVSVVNLTLIHNPAAKGPPRSLPPGAHLKRPRLQGRVSRSASPTSSNRISRRSRERPQSGRPGLTSAPCPSATTTTRPLSIATRTRSRTCRTRPSAVAPMAPRASTAQ